MFKVLQCDLSASEFDFPPRGHIELGEELGLIRQRSAFVTHTFFLSFFNVLVFFSQNETPLVSVLQTSCSRLRSQILLSEGSRSQTSDCTTKLCIGHTAESGKATLRFIEYRKNTVLVQYIYCTSCRASFRWLCLTC